MLVLLSPAKKLDLNPLKSPLAWSTPALWDESLRMMKKAKGWSRKELRSLMGISEALADLNYQRHNGFEYPFTPDNAKQAALCFDGDVYFGLDAKTITPETLGWAQEHLAILSGMFGILRPLDLIQPYRLEMGTKVKSRRGKNLYDFWGKSVTAHINQLTADHGDGLVVNLASKEYSKVIQDKGLKSGMVTIAFKEIKPGQSPKMIGTIAKRSRGKMARWVVDNQVDTREGLKAFDVDDYRFDAALSDEKTWVYTRAHVDGRMVAEFAARKERNLKLGL